MLKNVLIGLGVLAGVGVLAVVVALFFVNKNIVVKKAQVLELCDGVQKGSEVSAALKFLDKNKPDMVTLSQVNSVNVLGMLATTLDYKKDAPKIKSDLAAVAKGELDVMYTGFAFLRYFCTIQFEDGKVTETRTTTLD